MQAKTLTVPATLLLTAALGHAQVVYGTDNANDMDNYLLDVATTVSSGPVFTGQELFGLADDDTNMLLYGSEEGRVASWTYGSAAPMALAISPVDPSNGNSIRSEAMFHHANVLYGVDEFGAVGQEGIYSFDLVTGAATLVYLYQDTALDIGGMDVDPTTGLVYGTSDAAANQGIIEIDLGLGTETNIAAYPTGSNNDIDGLAVSPSGTLYLIQDQTTPIDTYDLGTGTYGATLPSSIVGSYVFSAGTWTDVLGGAGGSIGTNYCTAAVNSTGNAASMSATGSTSVAANDVTLMASDMPQNAFGFFATSLTQGFVANPGGSQGNLCLGGSIGRYVGAGQVQNSGATGSISLAIDLTQHPTPGGLIAVQVGETWNFTAWFRDSVGGVPTSNFADGLEITFN